MKDQVKNLLTERLAQLNCERVPAWLQTRLLTLIEAEADAITAKGEQQLHRQVARVVTTRSIAAAFVAGAPAHDGEGSKGEATPPLLPTGKAGTIARCA